MINLPISKHSDITIYLNKTFSGSYREKYTDDEFRKNVVNSFIAIAFYMNSKGLSDDNTNNLIQLSEQQIRFCPCAIPDDANEQNIFYAIYEKNIIELYINANNEMTNGQKATRYDAGKPRLDLIPLSILEDLARIYEYGANKYSENGWLSGFNYSTLTNSALRHQIAFTNKNEDNDTESGESHILHAIWNLITLFHQIKNKNGNDDRIFGVDSKKNQ